MESVFIDFLRFFIVFIGSNIHKKGSKKGQKKTASLICPAVFHYLSFH